MQKDGVRMGVYWRYWIHIETFMSADWRNTFYSLWLVQSTLAERYWKMKKIADEYLKPLNLKLIKYTTTNHWMPAQTLIDIYSGCA